MHMLDEPLYGFVGKETGVGVALRKDGDEILFASKQNSPLRWVALEPWRADANGDDKVDFKDYVITAKNWLDEVLWPFE